MVSFCQVRGSDDHAEGRVVASAGRHVVHVAADGDLLLLSAAIVLKICNILQTAGSLGTR